MQTSEGQAISRCCYPQQSESELQKLRLISNELNPQQCKFKLVELSVQWNIIC